MAHVKYFQQLADIQRQLERVITILKVKPLEVVIEDFGWALSETDTVELIEEELLLCRYFIAHRHEFARGDENIQKPSIETAKRCFTRHLAFLKETFDVTPSSVFPSSDYRHNVVKEAKCAKHYLFQFSLPAWYEKLPAEILTFDNKYPDFK